MARILGVHGVGNHDADRAPDDAATNLGKAWTEALATRLGGTGVDVEVAYYAHLLRPEAAQGAPGDGTDQHEMLLAWARALGAPPDIAQGWPTLPIRQFADWVAAKYGLDNVWVRWFVDTFLSEVSAYLDSSARRTVRRTVADAIARVQPSVVVAHSLGSVVAYEALHERPDLTVDLLVTLGSPLGMPDVVYERLAPSAVEASRPPGVRRWVNVADVGDLVAVPLLLPDAFRVDADLPESIGLFDFHRVRKYLASRTVAALVAGSR